MLAGASGNEMDSHSEIDDLAWLAGTWAGIGDDGTTTGDAYSVWTGPVEGVMSWTFRWHQADKGHVHFAFSVIEVTDDDILLRGIHHGRDFEPFEEVNWTMWLAATDTAFARFDCVENCRAASVEFARQDDGGLKESWRSTAGAAPEFVINYRRATPVEENIGRNR